MSRGLFSKFISAGVTAALLVTTPGIGCYQAAAQVRTSAGAPVEVVPAGAAAGGMGSPRALPAALSISPGVGLRLPATLSVAPASLQVRQAQPALTASGRASAATAAAARSVGAQAPAAAPTAVANAGLPTAQQPVARAGSVAAAKRSPAATPGAVVAAPSAWASAPRAPQAQAQARWAGRELEQGRTDASVTLSNLFDAGAYRRAAEPRVGAAEPRVGAAEPRVGAAEQIDVAGLARTPENGLQKHLTELRFGVAAVPAPAPEQGETPAPAPEAGGPAPKTGRAVVAAILAMGAAGAVAAYFGAPALLAFAVAHLPGAVAALVAAHPVAALWSLVGAGALGGIAGSQFGEWKAFPRALWTASALAGATTFHVWAMAGLRFDAALRGKPVEDGSKIETPANIFKYPVLAWPFVLAGYVFAPVAFGLGFTYKIAATPLVAAWKGVKTLAIEFFPWLVDFFSAIGRALRKAIPFTYGFLWGGIKATGVSIAIGAVTGARPLVANVLLAPYGGNRAIAGIGFRLVQLAGLGGIAVAGAAGALLGLALSPAYTLTYALYNGLKAARSTGSTFNVLDVWLKALEREEGFVLLSAATPEKAGAPLENLGAGAVLIRLLNIGAWAPHGLTALVPMSVTAYIRSWINTKRYLETGAFPPEKAGEVAVPHESRPDVEPPPRIAPRFFVPFLSAIGGAFVGMQLYNWFILIPLGLIGWPGVAAYAVAGLLGAGAGLALTRRWQLRGMPASIRTFATETAASNFRFWARAGLNADAALRNLGPDADTYREAPAALGRYPMLARPAVLAGYVSWASGLAAGALWRALAIPATAAWDAFVGMLESFMPFVRRVARFVWQMVRRIAPFGFGLVFGAVAGEFSAAVAAARVFTRSYEALGDTMSSVSDDLHGFEYVATLPLMLLGVIGFVASAALGVAAGLVFGVPAALTAGAALALRWADVGGRLEKAAYYWWKRTGPEAARGLERLTRDAFKPRKASFARVATQVGNLWLSSAALLLTSPVAAVAAGLRSIARAWRLAADPKASYDAESTRDGLLAKTVEPEPEPEPETPAVPAGNTPVAVTLTLGLAGLAGGALAPFWAPLPALGLAALIGVHAAAAIAGAALLLAASQPKAWEGALGRISSNATDAAAVTSDHWDRLGRGFDKALKGTDNEVPRRAGWLHAAIGFVASGVFGLLGALYGAALTPLRAAGRAMRQIGEELWPFLQRLWNFAYRLARRIVPFAFGWIAGAVTGVVGSALFGSLVVTRPYFKYVISRDFEKGGILNAIGRAALKSTAFLVAVALGVAGLAVGVAIAAPYALTLMPSMAFQLAGIGGPVQRFFDLWSKVRLREEMRRVDAFTGRLEFPEKEGRPLPIVEGWIRMANIAVFSLVAPFATLVLGLVGYFRSVANAVADARAGKTAPPSAGYDDLDVAWRAAHTGAKQTSRWGARTLSWAGGLAGLYAGWKAGVVTALWKSALWGFGGLAGGWLGGLILGGALGLAIGLIIWLGRQMEKQPPASTPAAAPTPERKP